MINDATLAHRHKFAVDASCECGITLSGLVRSQDAEIRRLQKLDTPELLDENQALMEENRRLRERSEFYYEDSMEMMEQRDAAYVAVDKLHADLAAYRAVVRELAEAATKARDAAIKVLCATTLDDAQALADEPIRGRLNTALAHPLVVQAREEKA